MRFKVVFDIVKRKTNPPAGALPGGSRPWSPDRRLSLSCRQGVVRTLPFAAITQRGGCHPLPHGCQSAAKTSLPVTRMLPEPAICCRHSDRAPLTKVLN
jgi:hypothetical protein